MVNLILMAGCDNRMQARCVFAPGEMGLFLKNSLKF